MATEERDSTRLLTHTERHVSIKNSRRPNSFVSQCCLAACTIPILLGFQMGSLSETISTIKKDLKTSDEQVALTAAILHVFAVFGSFLTSLISDRFGRPAAILSVGILFFTAPFFMGFTNNFSVILGRMIANVGVGYAFTVAPLYVAEISPPIHRGKLISLLDMFLRVGIIIGHLCNYLFSKIKFDGWRLMLCEGVVAFLLLTIPVLALQESPRWLVIKGRLADANAILTETYGSKREADLRLGDIMEAAGIRRDCKEDVVTVQSTERSLWRDLFDHPTQSVHHMVVLACLIQVFRQACGTDSVILLVPQILEKANIASANEKLFWVIGLELVKMVIASLATCHLDELGRRRPILIGIGGMAVCLLSLGISLKIIDQGGDKHKWAAHGCIGSLLGFVATSSIGMGPAASAYTSELFPLRLRARGCAAAFAVNQWTSAVMAVVSYLLHNAIGLGWTIILHAVVAFVAWGIFFKIIRTPETQGLTLEEMGRVFGELYQWRSMANETERGSSAMRQTEMTRSTGHRD